MNHVLSSTTVIQQPQSNFCLSTQEIDEKAELQLKYADEIDEEESSNSNTDEPRLQNESVQSASKQFTLRKSLNEFILDCLSCLGCCLP